MMSRHATIRPQTTRSLRIQRAPRRQLAFLFLLWIGLGVGVVASTAQAAPVYSIATVADSGMFGGAGPSAEAFGFNNAGTAAFGIMVPGGQDRIYSGNGGPLNLVVADSANQVVGGTFTYIDPYSISINDSGVVAYWMGSYSPSSTTYGIYTSNGAVIYAASADPGTSGPGETTAINNDGEVAFPLQSFGKSDTAIVRGSGGPLTTIASLAGNGFTSLGTVNGTPLSMNSNGTVAFVAGNPGTEGVYAGNGGALTTIYLGGVVPDPSAVPATLAPSINNSGNVAFEIYAPQILVGDGDPVIPTYPAGAGFEGQYPSINNLDEIASVYGSYNGPGGEIVVGSDPSTGRVIGYGDPLDGSTVTAFTDVEINDLGQVAFTAGLANGEYGLFIATPASELLAVPEPSSMIALATAAAGALCLTRIRRRASSRRHLLPL